MQNHFAHVVPSTQTLFLLSLPGCHEGMLPPHPSSLAKHLGYHWEWEQGLGLHSYEKGRWVFFPPKSRKSPLIKVLKQNKIYLFPHHL